MECLFIVIPAYNESENIEKTVEDWYPLVEKHSGNGTSRLLVINDGSKDDTYEILQRCAKDRPLLLPLTKPNGGHGPALLYGYRYAVKAGADYIFQTDSDGQTNPEEFEAFWEQREKYDAQFGNRTIRGDGASRAFVEKVLCSILWVIFGVKIPDANAPFRLMTAAYIREYLPKLPKNYNLPNAMLTTLGEYYHRRIAFHPISFQPRQGGTNSINIPKIVKIGKNAIRDFAAIRRNLK